MRAEVRLDGARPVIQALNGARSKLRKEWKRGAFAIGGEGVKVGRDAMSTEVRSAQRVRSYSHAVSDRAEGINLDIGPIRPGAGGRVAIHPRVFEGFDASGRKVDQFVIRAKNKPYLHFPIRRGPGLSRSNIIGWVKVKQVTLKPDPTFPTVERHVTPRLEEMGGRVFRDVLGGA